MPVVHRSLFRLHQWIGLIAGLYFVVASVSGAALVFRIELQRAMHPQLFTPRSGGPAADPAAVMESVRDAYPRYRLSGIDAPTTSRPTYLAYVVDGSRFLTLLVDPASAQLLGELPERSFVRWLQELHFNLLAGRAGRTAHGLGAACLLVMALTGIVIWWRRAARLETIRGLHGAVGMVAAIFIVMWAITGLYFAFPSRIRTVVNAISPLTQARMPSSRSDGDRTQRSWRELIERARQASPGQHVARVVVPTRGDDAFLVMFSTRAPAPAGADLTPIYLDQFSGEILPVPSREARTMGDVVMAWIPPLHVGNFGGTGIKVAWLILGLAPPLLFATGAIMWWTRVARRRLAGLAAPGRGTARP